MTVTRPVCKGNTLYTVVCQNDTPPHSLLLLLPSSSSSLRLTTLETESGGRISSLERELANANDLLSSARQHGSLPFTEGDLLSLSPTAASASTQLRSGMTLTQIYSRYVESCDQLQAEKEENARLNNYLNQILKELDEKAPALQKLRRDHDIAVQQNEHLQQQMEGMLEECEVLRIEVEEGRKVEREKERENQRLSALTADLSRQVKTLLRECEEARGGVASTSHDISSTDITSSHQVYMYMYMWCVYMYAVDTERLTSCFPLSTLFSPPPLSLSLFLLFPPPSSSSFSFSSSYSSSSPFS